MRNLIFIVTSTRSLQQQVNAVDHHLVTAHTTFVDQVRKSYREDKIDFGIIIALWQFCTFGFAASS